MKPSRKAQSLAAKLRRSARTRKDPLAALNAKELETLSRKAKNRAQNIRKERRAKRREAAESLLPMIRRKRQLRGCRIVIDVSPEGEVKLTVREPKQTRREPQDLPKPALALALFARAQAKRRKERFSVTNTLELIEERLGEPWPGDDTEAQRNSLKVAMSRLRDAPEALVAKLRTPTQIRRWAAKQADAGFERAAEVMIDMLK